MRRLLSLVVLAVAVGPPSALAASDVELRVLSTRADLVTGGDALVEVTGAGPGGVRVAVGGRDVTGAFSVRPNGRFQGLLTDLQSGVNVVTARLPDGRGARLEIHNHPSTGPVFSGPQTQPWRCDTEPQGLGPSAPPHCMAPTKVEYFYRSTNPAQTGWLAFDPKDPPSDVARTTTDQGKSVPFVVRQETGTLNRAIYGFIVLWDPAGTWSPWEPPPGWNGKLLFGFGGGAAMSHRQGTIGAIGAPPTVPPADPTIDQFDVLSRGYAIAAESLGRGAINTNDVTSAETSMMVKERIAEVMGQIRYTIGEGCSGGSINQSLISAAYPGILDATQPACTYQDWFTTGMESIDCNLLVRAFNASPQLWGDPGARAAASGQLSPTACPTHGDAGFALDRYWFDPTFGCHEFLAGRLPGVGDADQAWIYRPEGNPTGERCTLADDQVAIFGRRPRSAWGPVEQRIGRGFAPRPLDNVGVQYGLKALMAGRITAEQFVDLNEKIGGLDIDFNHVPQRMAADPEALEIAYRTGRITSGNTWGRIPIMDQGSFGNAEIHTDVRGHIIRARLRKANGHADNHVIWNHVAGQPSEAASLQSLEIVDRWLAAIEADHSDAPLDRKVARHRPAEAVDKCFVQDVEVSKDEGVCGTVYPYGATPRMAAGGPLAEDVFKCQLRPLDRDDYNGAVPPMSDAQFARLQKAFPDGVCDFTKPGVGYQQNVEWMSFAGGPGGTPLGDPPRSRPLGTPRAKRCAASAGFRSVAARPRGRGLFFDVERRQGRRFTVEVFRQSSGRRALGPTSRVSRFTRMSGSFGWRPRRLGDGRYVVRFTMRLDGRARDVRRVALRRVNGRFRAAPDFHQPAGCGRLRTSKLSGTLSVRASRLDAGSL